MNPIYNVLKNGCAEGQGFAQNYNPLYSLGGLIGHPGVDVSCGYGSPIAALCDGTIFSLYTIEHPALDGYTAVFTLCHTPLEDFEFSYGHVSEIDCQIDDYVKTGDIIAKEGNHGPVYAGNIKITLAMQAAGDQRGHHRHYQKRPTLKTTRLNGIGLQTAQGTYRDEAGFYYQEYAPNNGFNGCVDWTRPLFDRDLTVGFSGYDVLLLQRAMVREGFGTYAPTGFFGAQTWASVRSYQKALNIPATGYVGPLTRSKLNGTYSQLS